LKTRCKRRDNAGSHIEEGEFVPLQDFCKFDPDAKFHFE